MLTAREHFEIWLPEELEYSARKAGYDRKMEQAKKPIDDGQSMHSFLGNEWQQAQLMRSLGNHHSNEHRKTAQLQFAKFAAGLFDKAAMAIWIEDGSTVDTGAFVRAAHDATTLILTGGSLDIPTLLEKPIDYAHLLEQPFLNTPFATSIERLQSLLVDAYEGTIAPAIPKQLAIASGSLATQCYLAYADNDLAPDQFALAVSQL